MISILGSGAMGGAIAEGMVKSGACKPEEVCVTALHDETLKRFAEMGCRTTKDNSEAVRGASLIVLAVKPWFIEGVVKEIREEMDYTRQAVISVAAGIKLAQLNEWFCLNHEGKTAPERPQIHIAIPNTAIAYLQSMTFLVPDIEAKEEDVKPIEYLFSQMGKTIVTDEQHLTAGMALASCGIAYAMRYARAAAEGGVQLGFKAKQSTDIVLQTMAGAVALLQASGQHPEAAIDAVCTPGGFTIRGLNAMEHAGFTSSVIKGLLAAAGK